MTAYELRISDWSSDVCSSDLLRQAAGLGGNDPFGALVDHLKTAYGVRVAVLPPTPGESALRRYDPVGRRLEVSEALPQSSRNFQLAHQLGLLYASPVFDMLLKEGRVGGEARSLGRSEEHTSELQSLMRH